MAANMDLKVVEEKAVEFCKCVNEGLEAIAKADDWQHCCTLVLLHLEVAARVRSLRKIQTSEMVDYLMATFKALGYGGGDEE